MELLNFALALNDDKAFVESVRTQFDTGKPLSSRQLEYLVRMALMYSSQIPDCEATLKEHGIAYTYRNIKEENPSLEELRRWHAESGLPLKKFFNTSGLQYKALGLKDKLPTMSEEEQLALLATDGMLVKRPILVTEKGVTTGFKEAEWEKLL